LDNNNPGAIFYFIFFGMPLLIATIALILLAVQKWLDK
jgi:hypothetical protein